MLNRTVCDELQVRIDGKTESRHMGGGHDTTSIRVVPVESRPLCLNEGFFVCPFG